MPRINAEYRDEAKRKIVDAAIEVAAEDGWGSLTLDAIAKKVGVTKGAFYSYYKSSRELMQDVFLMLVRRIRDHVLANLEQEDDVNAALDQIADFIFLQPKPFIPIFLQAIAGMPKDPVLQKKVADLFDENSTLICAAIRRYQDDGQIPREVDLEIVAMAIYPLTMGLGMITHVMGKDKKKARKTWLHTVRRLLMIEPGQKRDRK
jgi:AcrR family transcriptional regulator